MSRNLSIVSDPSIVIVNFRRYQRLNSKNKPEPNPERGTGFRLVDVPVHGGERKPRKGA
jgi:hypothetical protein